MMKYKISLVGFRACLEIADNPVRCRRLVSQLPRVHRNVFVFVIAFLNEVLKRSADNGLQKRDLGMFVHLFIVVLIWGTAVLFSREMIRSKEIHHPATIDATAERKVQFIMHFLQ